jgi:hypothetical protein
MVVRPLIQIKIKKSELANEHSSNIYLKKIR